MHKLRQALSLQRAFAEASHRGLLFGAPLELSVGELAVGDVRYHAVPACAAMDVGHQCGFVTHPDRGAVAAKHPVFARHGRIGQLILFVEDPIAVVRVNLARPQTRVLDPLLGRETQDGLDSAADVMPLSINPGVGHVEDRRHLVDKRP